MRKMKMLAMAAVAHQLSGQVSTIHSRRGGGDGGAAEARDGPNLAKIWGRTNCTFDAAGRGTCLTGDCEGQLECKSYGAPPHTLAEYGLNTFTHEDYYGISLMKGFNVPMEFTPISNGCNRSVRCDANITADCPAQLTAPGGCHNPCQVYNTTQYCCGSGGQIRGLKTEGYIDGKNDRRLDDCLDLGL